MRTNRARAVGSHGRIGKNRVNCRIVRRTSIAGTNRLMQKASKRVLAGGKLVVTMAAPGTEHVRNIVLLGQDGAGKTSLAEALRNARVEEGPTEDYADDYDELLEVQRLISEISEAKSQFKELRQALDQRIIKRYETLTEDEIHHLLIDKKWFFGIYSGLDAGYETATTLFINKIVVLVERYENTLPELTAKANDIEARVLARLIEMGFTW